MPRVIELIEAVVKSVSEIGAGSWLVRADIAMRFDPLAGSGNGSVFWSFPSVANTKQIPELLIAAACHHYAHVLTIAEPWMTEAIHEHVQQLASQFASGPIGAGMDLAVAFPIGTRVALDPWPPLQALPDPEAQIYQVRLLAQRDSRRFRYSIRLRYQFNKVLIPASLFLILRDVVLVAPSSADRLEAAIRAMGEVYKTRPLGRIPGHWRVADAGLAAIGVAPSTAS